MTDNFDILGDVGESSQDSDGWTLSPSRGSLEGFTHVELNPELPTSQKLKTWFAKVHAEYVDLISQLGGSSGTFLIHAESLILRFALDENYRSDFQESRQFLRLIFHIECFLQSIQYCGGSFRLVFFDNFKRLLQIYSPALWALRQCMLLVCQTSSRHIDYVIFKSWTSPEFAHHISEWQPPFILIDDCSDLPPPEANDDKENEDETSIDTFLLSYPYALMLNCIVQQLHVASFFEIERRGRKVHAFVISPHNSALISLDTETTRLINQYEKEEAENKEATSESSNALNELIALWDEMKQRQNIGLRELIIAKFLQENSVVDETDESAEENLQLVVYFGKILLITSQLSRRLPLSNRCLVGFEGTDEWSFSESASPLIEFYLTETSNTLDQILNQSPRSTDENPSQLFEQLKAVAGGSSISRDAADLVDYRLLKTVLILVSQAIETSEWTLSGEFFDFPEDVCNDLNHLLTSVAGLNEPMFPIVASKISQNLQGASAIKSLGVPTPSEPGLLKVRSDFVQRLLGIEGRKGFEDGKLPFTNQMEEEPTIGNDFWSGPGQHWEEDLLMDVAITEIAAVTENKTQGLYVNEDKLNRYTGAYREIMKRRMQLRLHQKGAARVHKFATSIAGVSEFHYAVVVDKLGSHVWSIDEKLQDEANGKVEECNAVPGDTKEQKSKSEKKDKKPDKKGDSSKKVSTKAEEIIRKNEDAQKAKTLKLDGEKLPVVVGNLSSIGSKASTPKDLMNKILDVVVGYQRWTDELGNFKGISSALKLPESQLKALMKVVEILYSSITGNFKEIPKGVDYAVDIHKLVCFAFQFVHQVFRSFKSQISSEDIQLMQNLLIMLGFTNSSKCLFDSWVQTKLHDFESENVESGPKIEKKGKSGVKEGSKPKTDAATRKLKASLQNAYIEPSTIRKVSYAVPEGLESEIQLKFMGHQMERTLGSTTDPRVKFKPDQWQVRLLNAIDERRSALVCAPTGCGKTFACYYAMEKTLSFSDDAVVVYVCPSRALVQQVEIEIQGRFRSKEYPPRCRNVLTSSFLRNLPSKPLQCQILLTIPSMLEMLLMSPGSRDWVSRMRYVILDEIHCIGEGDEEGRAWERLVQLMPCPFLALSATVGNPESFHHWLGNAHVSGTISRHDKKPSVEIIQFGERYADLSTCVYSSDLLLDRDEVAKLIDADKLPQSLYTIPAGKKHLRFTGGLYSLNPFLCLTYKQVLLNGLSFDFYVPSADLLQVYYILRRILHERFNTQNKSTLSVAQQTELDMFFKSMGPKDYFVGTAAISKKQYRYYLQTFKVVFVSLVQREIVDENLFDAFIQQLGKGRPLTTAASILDGTVWNPCLEGTVVVSDVNGAKDTGFNLNLILGRPKVNESYKNVKDLLDFARRLHSLGLLPALVFNFNRSVVTHLCCSLVKALKDDQYQKYYGTPEAAARTKAINKMRMDKYKVLVKHREMLTKMRGLDKDQREEQGITTEDIEAELSEPLPPPPGDIADEYDEEFNFCGRRSWVTKSDEISDLIGDARRGFYTDFNPLYIEALERGIGLHHNGLPRHFRTSVESLFRKGYLRVVFSTDTLALGINMPCKSTVFISDSLQLTPLMYRQTSGRAGRRGFDTFGHIIFWEMPFPKLRRLICARLPVLSGEFPISPTLALRTFQLLNTVRTNHILGLRDATEKRRPVLEQRALQQQYKLEGVVLEESLTRLYQNPLFSVSSANMREDIEEASRLRWAIRYSFRFAIDFLRRNRLLDMGANCQSLAGLYSTLYETEPCNNVINWLLLSCALHRCLEKDGPEVPEIFPTDRMYPHSINPKWKIRRLISVLAFCLCRVKLNYNVFINMELTPEQNPFLPALPKEVLEAINIQNQLALENSIGYIQALSTVRAREHLDEENRLPFSGVNFNVANTLEPTDRNLKTLGGELKKMTFRAVARSPFAAICGREDHDFKTVEELCYSVRQTVYFEQSMVPQARTRMVNFEGVNLPLLSNYILDFISHGSLSHTTTHSAIDKNALWYALAEFRDTIEGIEKYIKHSLSQSASHSSSKPFDEASNVDIFASVLSEGYTLLQKCLMEEAA